MHENTRLIVLSSALLSKIELIGTDDTKNFIVKIEKNEMTFYDGNKNEYFISPIYLSECENDFTGEYSMESLKRLKTVLSAIQEQPIVVYLSYFIQIKDISL